ncbi:MAG: T9SS type A sorting domain-containing protein [Lentimicrobium sp.]|jgi:hypothetical protein|nr:T9SS type A sorting domain-containing protein [Lentimicrobium sp.]
MKIKSLFFILAIMPSFIQAQELMTIGEVFDFEVGDEFHSHSEMAQAMANGDRMSITDKYYSADSDTVFYVEQHNVYWSELSWEGGEPHLVYHYGSHENTIYYTNLNAPISEYDEGFLFNQQSYTTSRFCDSLVNACSYEVGPGFENDYFSREYGKGLGLVSAFHSSAVNGGGTLLNDKLFYYKKNGLTCGSPDLTGVNVERIAAKESGFVVYPNPAQYEIYLINNATTLSYVFFIMDGGGGVISTGISSATEQALPLGNYRPGIYFLLIRWDNKSTILKVIKE